MSLHVQVTRRNDLLIVNGQWETCFPLFQTFTVRVNPNETAAESVELAMMDLNLVSSWFWSKRTDSEVIEGEFTTAGGHKEVRDSNAKNVTL